MDIAAKINRIQEKLAPYQCTLVAVTKTQPVPLIVQAIEAGCLDLGENRVQEMQDKRPQLPESVRWHQIGHLQRNKVKYIAPYVHLIHAIDSLELLIEVNKQAARAGRPLPVLLQMFIAEEETKFGLSKEELEALLQDPRTAGLANVSIQGLMGMATNTDDEAQVRAEFRGLRRLFEACQKATPLPNVRFDTLSMGMSGDWQIAVEEGSTMVRIGSALFRE